MNTRGFIRVGRLIRDGKGVAVTGSRHRRGRCSRSFPSGLLRSATEHCFSLVWQFTWIPSKTFGLNSDPIGANLLIQKSSLVGPLVRRRHEPAQARLQQPLSCQLPVRCPRQCFLESLESRGVIGAPSDQLPLSIETKKFRFTAPIDLEHGALGC